MKKCAVLISLLLLFSGCSGPPTEVEIGMELRSKLLQAEECLFDSVITADYGDKFHIFSMQCKADSKGDLYFIVTEPESIAGISGKLSGDGGNLTFGDTALHFDLLAEEQISPISAPWILLKTLRSGYLASACTEGESVRLSIDDSYKADPLRLDIWLDRQELPVRAEILYDGRRILSVAVVNFQIV